MIIWINFCLELLLQSDARKKNQLDLPPLICLCLQTSMNVKALRQISVTPTLSVTTLKDPTLATAVWAIQEMVKIAQVNKGVIFRAYRK